MLKDFKYKLIWGSKYIRRIVERYKDLGFFNDSIASIMLGYFFIYITNLNFTPNIKLTLIRTIVNSIPATI